MGALATIEDYYAFRSLVYPPTPALDADQIAAIGNGLERATDRVKFYGLRLASYARAADGLPESDEQRAAIPRAVSAEYLAIVEAGGDLTGAAVEYDDVQALGVRFTRRAGVAATWKPADGLSMEARAILVNAGFYSTAVSH